MATQRDERAGRQTEHQAGEVVDHIAALAAAREQPEAATGGSRSRTGRHDRRDAMPTFRGDDGSHAMASPSGMNSAILRLMSLILLEIGRRGQPQSREVAGTRRDGSGPEPAMDRRQGRDQDDGRPRYASSQPSHGGVRSARAAGGAQRRATGTATMTPGQNQMTPFIGGRRRDPAVDRPRRATRPRPSGVTPGRPCGSEPFRQTALGAALDATQPGQPEERLRAEPVSVALGRVRRDQQVGLLPSGPCRDVDVEVRPAQVAVELGDLELEDQVVAERLPGQLADEPVVLVEVVAVVGQDEVRRDRRP